MGLPKVRRATHKGPRSSRSCGFRNWERFHYRGKVGGKGAQKWALVS